MKKSKVAPGQFEFDFSSKVAAGQGEETRLLEYVEAFSEPLGVDEPMMCDIVADTVKKAQGEAGMSRDQVVDGINRMLGRTREPKMVGDMKGRQPLTVDMLNNMMAKPYRYPIQAQVLFAACVVTQSVAPLRPVVSALRRTIIDEEERRFLTLGKARKIITEMRELERALLSEMG